jgi:hypothetical protein
MECNTLKRIGKVFRQFDLNEKVKSTDFYVAILIEFKAMFLIITGAMDILHGKFSWSISYFPGIGSHAYLNKRLI